MKYRYGCDAIDELAKLGTLNEAMSYNPEKADDILDEFRTLYKNLPENIKKQWWLQEKDWYWFLNHCGRDL